MKATLFTGVLAAAGAFVNAQSAELVTDRPDQTESSSVVSAGVFQLETGFVFTRRNLPGGGVEETDDLATTLLRIGLLRHVELRLISGYTRYRPGILSTPEINGMQPLSVGGKFALTKEKGLWPEVALIGHITLPWIGNETLAPAFIAPDFRFSLSHSLSSRFSLGYNIGMYWDGMMPRAHLIYTLALGASVAGPVGVFVEVFGEIPERLKGMHNADFGVTVLVTPDLQFDASYGFPLEKDAHAHFLNAGLSFRFATR